MPGTDSSLASDPGNSPLRRDVAPTKPNIQRLQSIPSFPGWSPTTGDRPTQ